MQLTVHTEIPTKEIYMQLQTKYQKDPIFSSFAANCINHTNLENSPKIPVCAIDTTKNLLIPQEVFANPPKSFQKAAPSKRADTVQQKEIRPPLSLLNSKKLGSAFICNDKMLI